MQQQLFALVVLASVFLGTFAFFAPIDMMLEKEKQVDKRGPWNDFKSDWIQQHGHQSRAQIFVPVDGPATKKEKRGPWSDFKSDWIKEHAFQRRERACKCTNLFQPPSRGSSV